MEKKSDEGSSHEEDNDAKESIEETSHDERKDVTDEEATKTQYRNNDSGTKGAPCPSSPPQLIPSGNIHTLDSCHLTSLTGQDHHTEITKRGFCHSLAIAIAIAIARAGTSIMI